MIDISNLSNQEIFNKVWHGAALQNFERSTDQFDFSVCKYRNYAGLKCLLGHLISDEAYDECIEGEIACNIFKTNRSQDMLIEKLQEIHDKSSKSAEVKAKLIELAESYKFHQYDVSEMR